MLIAVSLCNGGEAAYSLSECIFNLIAIGEHACKPTINDVSHCDVRKTIQQVVDQLLFPFEDNIHY
jgi:hypothetical protein